MIRKMSKELLRKLEQGIGSLNGQDTSPQERVAGSMQLVRQGLSRLRGLVAEHGFTDEAEEINFFKHIKPMFYCLQIYAHEHYQLELRFPMGELEAQRDFLKSELDHVERFFLVNGLHYQYYRIGATELDGLYFLRSSKGESLLFPQLPDLDPEFSTPCDYLFARFRAMEMVRDWLIEQLGFLAANPGVAIASLAGDVAGELKWTGDSVNLAELAYGLYLSRQLNHGSAGIAQVFRWLEEKLQVNIGVPAKRFAAIRSRKRLSQTKFMDEMREAILHKIELEDRL